MLPFLTAGERTMVFMDGPAIYNNSRQLDFEFDYNKFREEIAKRCKLVRICYYTTLKYSQDENGDEILSVRPLLDYLQYHGYTVIEKEKREVLSSNGVTRFRGNCYIELTTDALTNTDNIDHVILCTGDGDFTYLVKKLQDRGKIVSVISTVKTNPSSIADELRRQADFFGDLANFKDSISRKRLEAAK